MRGITCRAEMMLDAHSPRLAPCRPGIFRFRSKMDLFWRDMPTANSPKERNKDIGAGFDSTKRIEETQSWRDIFLDF